jgi:hypothetical protein
MFDQKRFHIASYLLQFGVHGLSKSLEFTGGICKFEFPFFQQANEFVEGSHFLK